LPGLAVQIDVKFIEPIKGSRKRYYQFTAIDDCTRLRILRGPVHPDGQWFRIPVGLPLAPARPGHPTHLHQAGRPSAQRQSRERFHRIDNEEFYRQLEIDTAELFNDKLGEWERFYNYARPHGSLNGQTPYERLRQKTSTSV
jgi:hypothetical protein